METFVWGDWNHKRRCGCDHDRKRFDFDVCPKCGHSFRKDARDRDDFRKHDFDRDCDKFRHDDRDHDCCCKRRVRRSACCDKFVW